MPRPDHHHQREHEGHPWRRRQGGGRRTGRQHADQGGHCRHGRRYPTLDRSGRKGGTRYRARHSGGRSHGHVRSRHPGGGGMRAASRGLLRARRALVGNVPRAGRLSDRSAHRLSRLGHLDQAQGQRYRLVLRWRLCRRRGLRRHRHARCEPRHLQTPRREGRQARRRRPLWRYHRRELVFRPAKARGGHIGHPRGADLRPGLCIGRGARRSECSRRRPVRRCGNLRLQRCEQGAGRLLHRR